MRPQHQGCICLYRGLLLLAEGRVEGDGDQEEYHPGVIPEDVDGDAAVVVEIHLDTYWFAWKLSRLAKGT